MSNIKQKLGLALMAIISASVIFLIIFTLLQVIYQ